MYLKNLIHIVYIKRKKLFKIKIKDVNYEMIDIEYKIIYQ
jgi:hypothetical protein